LASLGTVLEELARAACQQEGAELWEVVRTSGRGRQVVRVTVDHPEGVSMDLLARVSRRLSRALDAADPIPGSYVLECESPGPRRRLRDLADCTRFLGERARVRVRDGDGRPRTLSGRIRTVEEGRIHLDVDGGEVCPVDWTAVEAANLDQER